MNRRHWNSAGRQHHAKHRNSPDRFARKTRKLNHMRPQLPSRQRAALDARRNLARPSHSAESRARSVAVSTAGALPPEAAAEEEPPWNRDLSAYIPNLALTVQGGRGG